MSREDMLFAFQENLRKRMDLPSNLPSSLLTKAGDTVDERIIVAPDGSAEKLRNSQIRYSDTRAQHQEMTPTSQ